MKSIRFLTVIFVLSCFMGCTDDGDDEITKGEGNATVISDVLSQNTIKWVRIYEYDYSTGGWNLAADNQTYTEGMDLCHVERTYFYLNGVGSKTYPVGEAPTHQLSGFYYFDLEYLVSFELGPNQDALYLYFKY